VNGGILGATLIESQTILAAGVYGWLMVGLILGFGLVTSHKTLLPTPQRGLAERNDKR